MQATLNKLIAWQSMHGESCSYLLLRETWVPAAGLNTLHVHVGACPLGP